VLRNSSAWQVVYAGDPPDGDITLGRLWMDTDASPPTLYSCTQLDPVVFEPVTGGGSPGPAGPEGPEGPQGVPGEGVPPGGAAGEVLAKASGTDYDTEWVPQTGGGGGFSFNPSGW
jgi:hypothetical protein